MYGAERTFALYHLTEQFSTLIYKTLSTYLMLSHQKDVDGELLNPTNTFVGRFLSVFTRVLMDLISLLVNFTLVDIY